MESEKKVYISTLLNNNVSCPKIFWKCINHFLKGDYGSYQLPRLLDPNDDNTVPLGHKASFLKEFFCNISTCLGFDLHKTLIIRIYIFSC